MKKIIEVSLRFEVVNDDGQVDLIIKKMTGYVSSKFITRFNLSVSDFLGIRDLYKPLMDPIPKNDSDGED